MTARLREPAPGAAFLTSWPDRRVVGSVALVGALVGLFLSIAGAYGSDALPILPRSAFMVGVAIAASLIGVFVFRLVGRHPAIAERWWLHGLVAAAVMSAPMALVVWTGLQVVQRHGPPVAAIPRFWPTSLATSAFFCLWASYQRRRRLVLTAAAPAAAAAPPRFLQRIPLRLRDGELWAVEAEDHYLRLHTSAGQDLILMRFADALAELQGIEGAQVHRSWWVSRAAIAEARRGDGRATLTLKDGAEAPVSRTFARELRALGWI